MDFSGISNAINAASTSVPAARIESPETEGSSFAGLVEELLVNTELDQDQVGTEVQKIITGEATSMHEVSLAVANADLSFRFMMQLRDQLIQTYREVIRMQV